MARPTETSVWESLGVKPVINCNGHMTMLGGSSLSPGVRATMEAANRYFVEMSDLLAKSGELIAGWLGAEAAYVTPGAAAAIALGTAACIAGLDGEKVRRIPDTAGMRREVVIQKRQRFPYDRLPTIVGGKLVEVGDEAGTTAEQLDAALGPDTVMVFYAAHLEWQEGVVSLAETLRLAHAKGIPVLVDAAGQVFPLDHMKSYPGMGADLVCYGAKYFRAPNSSGILCGRKALVDAAAAQGFVSFETHGPKAFGRPLKIDRQEVVAVVAALREWLDMDHEARLAEHERRAATIAKAVDGLPGVTARREPKFPGSATWQLVDVDPSRAKRTAAEVVAHLKAGYPSVWIGRRDDTIIAAVECLQEGDAELVGERLREALE